MSSNREHLQAVNEGYFEHMRHALSYSYRLMKASLACLIHALFPGRCASTASSEIRCLHNEITARLNSDET